MTEKIQSCPVCNETDFSDFLVVEDHFLTKEEFKIQKCNGCGFKFINPRPVKADIGLYYQSEEYISHDAKKANLFNNIYKMARVFSIKRKFAVVEEAIHTGKILDIGCGTGEFLRYCQSRGFTVTGVEPNDKARLYAHEQHKIPVHASLNSLAGLAPAYNCITMWHVLEHVHDLNETLEEVRGLLKPGGIFVVAVPNCNSWDAQKYGKFWAAYDVPRHLYHFVDSTLHKLVLKHGFIIQKTIPQKLDAYYVTMLSEKYQSGKSNYLKSVILGFWSNLQARRQKIGYSSQIFILSRKNT